MKNVSPDDGTTRSPGVDPKNPLLVVEEVEEVGRANKARASCESQDAAKEASHTCHTSNHSMENRSPPRRQRRNDQEAVIDQIVQFWNHPALKDVSPAQKQDYLMKQQGIRKDQMDMAWDQINLTSSLKVQQPLLPPPTTRQSTPPTHENTNISTGSPQHPLVSPHYNHNHYRNRITTSSTTRRRADDSVSISRLVAFSATIGGFLGLLAAATIRWFNGGDFRLSTSNHNTNTTTRIAVASSCDPPGNRHATSRVTSSDPPGDRHSTTAMSRTQEDDEDCDDSSTLDDTIPDQAIRSLSETLQQHVTVEQQILQRLASSNGGCDQDGAAESNNIHDDTKQQQDHTDKVANYKTTKHPPPTSTTATTTTLLQHPMLWYKLAEIQVQLATLKHYRHLTPSTNNQNSLTGKQLEETLMLLQTMLHGLQPTTKRVILCKEEEDGSDSIIDKAISFETVTTVQTTESKTTPNHHPPTGHGVETASTQPLLSDGSGSPFLFDDDEEHPENSFPYIGTVLSPSCEMEEDDNDETTTTLSVTSKLREALTNLVEQNAHQPEALKAAIHMLYLYISNLPTNPHAPRYRLIFTTTKSYKMVHQLPGAYDLLCTLGFVARQDGRVLEWLPEQLVAGDSSMTTQSREDLLECYRVREAGAALTILRKIGPRATVDKTQRATQYWLKKALEVLPEKEPHESMVRQLFPTK
ncbi:expressed unknown protein [Seminavis robusta]|uniref:Transmembrane protein n=1 Tax=Seminavis robusta TaxID=568900 RepID=A0A9N8DVJ0_9STRA|nr:expressed unknown protein [Seminavis robusta]|eukprot:Sro389_g132590.1 n/a (697) ;mRNA; r:31405-33495